jgi:hypothetical protein
MKHCPTHIIIRGIQEPQLKPQYLGTQSHPTATNISPELQIHLPTGADTRGPAEAAVPRDPVPPHCYHHFTIYQQGLI